MKERYYALASQLSIIGIKYNWLRIKRGWREYKQLNVYYFMIFTLMIKDKTIVDTEEKLWALDDWWSMVLYSLSYILISL